MVNSNADITAGKAKPPLGSQRAWVGGPMNFITHDQNRQMESEIHTCKDNNREGMRRLCTWQMSMEY